ncbi:alpha-hydroxyketone-type quorum-sensing autoinducer synthase [Enterobacter mori]
MKRKSLPFFIKQRIKEKYQDRFMNEWGGVHILRPKPSAADDVLLCSNDYLCLRRDRNLFFKSTGSYDDVLMSSVFLGSSSLQSRLEKQFACFFNFENSIVCQSGWTANAGLIQSIANEQVPVYIDFFAHMSFHDGIRLANAKSYVFEHNNVNSAKRKILRYGPGIIIIDSVYSTNGSLCPLSDFAILAKEYGCALVVDESHSAGTHGREGRGLVSALDLTENVDFITVSLAKAFAGRAGLIVCNTEFKDYFLTESHPAIFSSAVMNYDLQWFSDVIPFVISSDERRNRLHANAKYVRGGLKDAGYNVSGGTEQIIAVEIGFEKDVQTLQNKLYDKGIVGSVFCYPATAKNKAVIRLTINSGLSDIDLSRIVNGFRDVTQQ